MIRIRTAAIRRLAALLVAAAAGGAAAQAPRIVELTAGFHRIEAEVVATQETRAKGLMNRTSMPANHGMLFVFDQPGQHCMWMRNTLIPLAVAFLDDQGRIVNVEEMRPRTETNHCAAKPVRFALEMNGGWFKSRGLAAGTVIGGIARK
ncbi:MAG TPA: DUF192 domain-containing protein [Rhodocyclaceae bacterium]|nr:DUF192 domain-containing protein [Rhodocyclaceae bacterium]